MPIVSNRLRYKPLVAGVLAASLAGFACAQTPVSPDTDAAFRQNVGSHAPGTVPGGVVVSKNGNSVQIAAPTPVTPIQHVILIIGATALGNLMDMFNFSGIAAAKD